MKPKISVGISNFKKLRKEPGHFPFVDKSLFIRDVISGDEVMLFTRPRRFGKTLNQSMLYYYFSCTEEDTAKLFDGLKIQEAGERYTAEQGQYPTISITLKSVEGGTFSLAYGKLMTTIVRCYKQFDYLLDGKVLDKHEIDYFERIRSKQAPQDEFETSLSQLIIWLYNYHKKPVVVLIDEYDAPIRSAFFSGDTNYYEKILDLMRSLLGDALKDNDYLYKGVLTGVSDAAKADIFSGANNVETYGLLDAQYAEYFGLTEDEVVELLKQFSVTTAIQAVREWYNGYYVGGNVLYNPKSILSFISRGKLAAYWVDTSKDQYLKILVVNAGSALNEQLAALLQGQAVKSRLDKSLILEELKTQDTAAMSLLYMAGYVNAVPQEEDQSDDYDPMYSLRIPNKEVHRAFNRLMARWLGGNEQVEWLLESLDYLKAGNITKFAIRLKEIAHNVFSYYDTDNKDGEKFYHGFLLCLALFIGDDYLALSNREAGDGRADIILLPKDAKKGLKGIILELKRSQDVSQLAQLAEEAYQQIEEKKYHKLPQTENAKGWFKVGIAFSGKEVSVFSPMN